MKYAVIAAVAALLFAAPAAVRAEEKAKDHAEHKHDHGKGHEGEGDMKADLGTTETGGLKISATQLTKIAGGKEAVFELVTEGKDQPKAIRAWVGTRSAQGSAKGKAEKEDGGHWHLHVEVPAKVPEGSQLWLEVEAEDGKRTKIEFDTKSE